MCGSLHATVRTTAGTTIQADVDIDLWLFGFGVGWTAGHLGIQ
jgi:outer membrane protein W